MRTFTPTGCLGAGFSIEGPTGNRFIIRSRIFTEEETAELEPVS